MSKTIALLGASAALVAFSGCGDDDEEKSDRTVTTPKTTPAAVGNLPGAVKAIRRSQFAPGQETTPEGPATTPETTPTGPSTTPTTPPPGTQIIDNERLEAHIKQTIEQQANVQVQSVDCDDNVPIEAGRVSFCVVVLVDGRQGRVQVTQVDDQGNIRWEVI